MTFVKTEHTSRQGSTNLCPGQCARKRDRSFASAIASYLYPAACRLKSSAYSPFEARSS
jgi:hypothetical protein